MVLTLKDLLELGVLQGHFALIPNASTTPSEDQPEAVELIVVPPVSGHLATADDGDKSGVKNGPEFCEITSAGAPQCFQRLSSVGHKIPRVSSPPPLSYDDDRGGTKGGTRSAY